MHTTADIAQGFMVIQKSHLDWDSDSLVQDVQFEGTVEV